MSGAVALLPTRANLEAAWDEYRGLVVAMHEDQRLQADLDHCMRVARAWGRWMELFLAWDARC